MTNEYIINSMTLMLKYIDETKTLVYEDDREIIVDLNIFDIVSGSCYFYGSTYSGRILYSKSVLKTNIKVPIFIDYLNDIILFPTKSYKNKDCIWIIYNNVKKFEKYKYGSKICFKNNKEFFTPTSYEIIDRQIYNCLRLEKENKFKKNISI